MIVLLHGFTGSPASWDEILPLLPPRSEVIRETLLGHGPTESDDAGVSTFEDEVDRLAARLRERGVERAQLVGYSLGARVGLGLLARHPKLFNRATLCSLHPGLATDEERAERIESDERWAELVERDGIVSFVAAWESQPLFHSQAQVDPALLATQRAIRLSHRPAGLARALRVLGLGHMPDYRETLSRLEIPLALLVGSHDEKFRVLVDSVPHSDQAELRIVESCGHNVPLERPEDFAFAVEELELEVYR